MLSTNEQLLNFCFISSSFFKFVTESGKNFEKISDKIYKNMNCIKEFDDLNNENFMNHLDNMSSININDDKEKEKKLELIYSVFGKEINGEIISEIFLKIIKKININMFCDKFKLIELLSNKIICFLFEIFDPSSTKIISIFL